MKTIYSAITYNIFGSIDDLKTFESKTLADAFVIEWANKNCPFSKKFSTSEAAISWFTNNDEEIEMSIDLRETEIEVATEDYEMLASENKLMGEFLSNLGYSQEQVSEIANTGALAVNIIREPQDDKFKRDIGSLGYVDNLE